MHVKHRITCMKPISNEQTFSLQLTDSVYPGHISGTGLDFRMSMCQQEKGTRGIRQEAHRLTDNMQSLVWPIDRTFARQLNLAFHPVEPCSKYEQGYLILCSYAANINDIISLNHFSELKPYKPSSVNLEAEAGRAEMMLIIHIIYSLHQYRRIGISAKLPYRHALKYH